ncbi:hypothetical protein J2T11_003189 [Paenarthrobacter nicotinovorans]|jgi:hypothetical protein|uniref:nuclear transport factor 2 family protein n=1 Tax=Paenarthrobacter nicotinovorans TaxID=29320 RepID=UPI0027829B05|nr:nuclear transport factor 2 family protein [Paenarthrobacter nicotinovorans]MDP9936821.1 hypothetical protein [Paenarthrobacter nicotinovorans]
MTRFADLPREEQRERIETTIRTYFDGCNEADVEKMTAQFTDDAIHYFPPGLNGPWVGSQTIAENWRKLTITIDSAWSIERLIGEPESLQAAIEFTHWKPARNGYVRGSEWYKFDPESGKITEIRAFYSSSADNRDANTLEGYDYEANGYRMAAPVLRPHPDFVTT